MVLVQVKLGDSLSGRRNWRLVLVSYRAWEMKIKNGSKREIAVRGGGEGYESELLLLVASAWLFIENG